MLRFGAEGQFDVLQSRSVRGWLAATVGLTRRGQPSSVAEDYIDEDRPRDEADCFGTRSQPRGQKIPAAGDALVSVGGMLLAGGHDIGERILFASQWHHPRSLDGAGRKAAVRATPQPLRSRLSREIVVVE